jgi:Na+-transporting methylmalonyl-CoA/oxaloacetate decarboxylase gamma subunit
MKISIGEALGISVLGMLVVFLMLVILMVIIFAMTSIMERPGRKSKVVSAPEAATSAVTAEAPTAPGSCGEVSVYDVPDATAAMLMAIVADKLDTPLNELRFISIKEVQGEDR